MKFLSLIVCAAFLAFILPACATAPKKTDSCCSATGKCETPAKKHKH